MTRQAEMSRLFFALWPSAIVRERLARVAQSIHAGCGGRLMQPRNLHLTLAFLGDTDLTHRAAALAAARLVAVMPLRIVIDRMGYFRQGRQRGVVWAGGEAPAALVELSGSLRGALKAAEVTFDGKPLVPHVTLLRDARAPEATCTFDPIEWNSDAFVLVESTRDEAGVRYDIVERFGAGEP